MAHRSGRIIDTDALISLVLHVSSDGQEREQGSEDNPGVSAHQSSPAAVLPIEQLGISAQHFKRLSPADHPRNGC